MSIDTAIAKRLYSFPGAPKYCALEYKDLPDKKPYGFWMLPDLTLIPVYGVAEHRIVAHFYVVQDKSLCPLWEEAEVGGMGMRGFLYLRGWLEIVFGISHENPPDTAMYVRTNGIHQRMRQRQMRMAKDVAALYGVAMIIDEEEKYPMVGT